MTTRKPPKSNAAQVNPVVKAAADQTSRRKKSSAVQLELFPLTTVTAFTSMPGCRSAITRATASSEAVSVSMRNGRGFGGIATS